MSFNLNMNARIARIRIFARFIVRANYSGVSEVYAKKVQPLGSGGWIYDPFVGVERVRISHNQIKKHSILFEFPIFRYVRNCLLFK